MFEDDITFCSTCCNERNCRRNLRFRTPQDKYISVSDLGKIDKNDTDRNNKNCKYKLYLIVKEA